MGEQSILIAKKFVKKIKEDIKIERVILFGSRARGDNLKGSDFDFIIVSKEFEKSPFVLRAAVFYDYWDQKVDVEILCYTPKEFEKKMRQIGIVKTAVEEGIEL